MIPVVLVHGGSFAGSCWDLVVDRLASPAVAVDLPGRGRHPIAPDRLTIERAAASVVADVDAAGFDQIVLVGHSLAGCSMPATIGLLGDRVQHAVFVACTVPAHGTSCVDTLPAELQGLVRTLVETGQAGKPDPAMAKELFGNDLDDAAFAWMLERIVAEPPGLLIEPVDLRPLRSAMPRTWIRPVHDAVVDPVEQLRFARNAGASEIVDIDAGHMVMISRPAELAATIDGIARDP